MESTAPGTIFSGEQRLVLERWVAAHGTPQDVALRARIALMAAAGESRSEGACTRGQGQQCTSVRGPVDCREDESSVRAPAPPCIPPTNMTRSS
jgi:hypothetical protein